MMIVFIWVFYIGMLINGGGLVVCAINGPINKFSKRFTRLELCIIYTLTTMASAAMWDLTMTLYFIHNAT